MFPAVPSPDLPCPGPAKTLPWKEACHDHKQCRHAGWDEIYHIIQFCRKPSKIQVLFILISHHGIHGIHRFIGKAEHRSTDCQINHRRNHTVGCIFRNGLNRCLCHTCFIQLFRITPNDHGDCLSRCRQILLLQLLIYLHAFHFQTLCSKNLIGHNGFHGTANRRMQTVCPLKDNGGYTGCPCDNNHNHRKPAQKFSCV